MTHSLLPRLGALSLLLGLLVLACAPAAAPPPGPTRAAPTAEAEDEEEDDSSFAKPGGAPTATPRPLPTSSVTGQRVELIAEGLLFPQSLTFAPDDRLFFVEVKKGTLRVMTGKTLQPDPVLTLKISQETEHGLVSLALDPGFAANHFLYTDYSQPGKGERDDEPRRHRLTRWTESRGTANGETAVLDGLPIGKCCHTGGKMAFAADGSMFLALGDQGDASRRDAQDPKKLNGKLLHFDPARVVQQRPEPTSLIYASGLRNPYGLDVHPVSGDPILADNGPDNCDELNIAHQGANFGNPVAECATSDGRFVDPAWSSGLDRLGVTGLEIYRGRMFPQFENHALFCSVNTGNLMLAVLSPDYKRVERVEQVLSGEDGEGCRLDVTVAPDGSIYFSSISKLYRLFR